MRLRAIRYPCIMKICVSWITVWITPWIDLSAQKRPLSGGLTRFSVWSGLHAPTCRAWCSSGRSRRHNAFQRCSVCPCAHRCRSGRPLNFLSPLDLLGARNDVTSQKPPQGFFVMRLWLNFGVSQQDIKPPPPRPTRVHACKCRPVFCLLHFPKRAHRPGRLAPPVVKFDPLFFQHVQQRLHLFSGRRKFQHPVPRLLVRGNTSERTSRYEQAHAHRPARAHRPAKRNRSAALTHCPPLQSNLAWLLLL